LNAPKRPGISCLLLGLLLAGTSLISVSQLKAQPPLPGPIPTVPPRGDVGLGRAKPPPSRGERIERTKERGSGLLRGGETTGEDSRVEWVERGLEWQGEARSESFDEEEMGVEWVYEAQDPGDEIVGEGEEAVDGFVSPEEGSVTRSTS